jgi:hypothetical protein
MTQETVVDTTQAASTETIVTPQTEGPKTLEEAMALIENLKGINKEVISGRDKEKQKLKQFETEQQQREQTLLTEQGKFKELYEAQIAETTKLKTGLKSKAIDAALKEALQKSGARAVDTVSKLIDKSKIEVSEEDWTVNTTAIQAQIEEMKKTDPILFGVSEGTNLPPVKRPGDGTPSAGFETEMRAAKTQQEIQSIMKKYGKI